MALFCVSLSAVLGDIKAARQRRVGMRDFMQLLRFGVGETGSNAG